MQFCLNLSEDEKAMLVAQEAEVAAYLAYKRNPCEETRAAYSVAAETLQAAFHKAYPEY